MFFREENGWTCAKESADYVWVLDPIELTKAFITGKPLFGTLIVLLHSGKPVMGIIDQPILRERWVGVDWRKTTLNEQEVHTYSNVFYLGCGEHYFSCDFFQQFHFNFLLCFYVFV